MGEYIDNSETYDYSITIDTLEPNQNYYLILFIENLEGHLYNNGDPLKYEFNTCIKS